MERHEAVGAATALLGASRIVSKGDRARDTGKLEDEDEVSQ